jgi:hypothetical protein
LPTPRLPRAFKATSDMPEPLRESIETAQQSFTPSELELISRECWTLDLLPYEDPRIALRFCMSQSRHVRVSDRLADKLADIDQPVAWAVVRCLQAADNTSEGPPVSGEPSSP